MPKPTRPSPRKPSAKAAAEPLPAQCCANCGLWQPVSKEDQNPEGPRKGFCLRYPPRAAWEPDVIEIDPQTQKKTLKARVVTTAPFPILYERQRCGEFQPASA